MTSDRQRRTAEPERNKLTEERSSTGFKEALAIKEKRRLDARIAAMEGEREEEQTQSKMLREHGRKNQISIEQQTTEQASERSNAYKIETGRWCWRRRSRISR